MKNYALEELMIKAQEGELTLLDLKESIDKGEITYEDGLDLVKYILNSK